MNMEIVNNYAEIKQSKIRYMKYIPALYDNIVVNMHLGTEEVTTKENVRNTFGNNRIIRKKIQIDFRMGCCMQIFRNGFSKGIIKNS